MGGDAVGFSTTLYCDQSEGSVGTGSAPSVGKMVVLETLDLEYVEIGNFGWRKELHRLRYHGKSCTYSLLGV